MKKLFFLIFSSAIFCYSQNIDFDRFFIDNTMRIDYFHSGAKSNESFALDHIFAYPKWAGNKINLIDDRNLGEYLVKIYDAKSDQLIYSHGYCTLFNEWQTTDEALKGLFKTFSESALIPFPKESVKMVIARRDRKMKFNDIFTTTIDPKDPIINRENRNPDFKVSKILENGPPDKKVDLVIIGDGYAKEDIPKFKKDAERFTNTFFNTSPFKECKKDFNIYAVEAVSENSGIDNPVKNIWKKTAVSTSFYSFQSQRYILTTDNVALRDIAGLVPYDYICILVNSDEYGGGGIYNQYLTCFTSSTKPELDWQCDYVFVHEFGHLFSGLGDEYYTSDVAYNDFYPEGVEPWEPNLTRLLDKNNLKWGNLIEKNIPVPTPWGKEIYDSLDSSMRKLDRSNSDYYTKRKEITEKQSDLKKKQKYSQKIGCFEGAGYASKGIYRPYIDCRMFSLSLIGFDPVCSATLKKTIDFFTK
jgi:hypothetical protein